MVLRAFVLLTILISNFSFAAKVRGKKLISTLEKNLSVQKDKVSKLKASIHTIENEIGKKNSSYLRRLVQLKKLDGLKAEMKSELIYNSNLADDEVKRINIILAKLVGTALSENMEQVYERAVLKDLISVRLGKLNSYKNNNQNIQSELSKVQNKIEMVRGIEQDLFSFIQNMENRKGGLARQYLRELDQKDSLEKRLSKQKLELAAKRMARNRKTKQQKSFSAPIKGYSKYRLEKKGISFFYKGTKPILASKSGTVVYSGKLAAYGQVLMVDHGDNIRSVLLGRFRTKVKKGENLKEGQTIAFTNNAKKDDNLYFEIRKKNKAQKVLSYLDFSKDLVKI